MGVFKGISTILKGGFLGYCIYYTIERRVWDDPIFSPPQLNHIQKVMFPDLPEKIDKLPDKVTIYKACRDSWNRALLAGEGSENDLTIQKFLLPVRTDSKNVNDLNIRLSDIDSSCFPKINSRFYTINITDKIYEKITNPFSGKHIIYSLNDEQLKHILDPDNSYSLKNWIIYSPFILEEIAFSSSGNRIWTNINHDYSSKKQQNSSKYSSQFVRNNIPNEQFFRLKLIPGKHEYSLIFGLNKNINLGNDTDYNYNNETNNKLLLIKNDEMDILIRILPVKSFISLTPTPTVLFLSDSVPDLQPFAFAKRFHKFPAINPYIYSRLNAIKNISVFDQNTSDLNLAAMLEYYESIVKNDASQLNDIVLALNYNENIPPALIRYIQKTFKLNSDTNTLFIKLSDVKSAKLKSELSLDVTSNKVLSKNLFSVDLVSHEDSRIGGRSTFDNEDDHALDINDVNEYPRNFEKVSDYQFEILNRWDQYSFFRKGYYWSVNMKEKPTPVNLTHLYDTDNHNPVYNFESQIYLQPSKGKYLFGSSSMDRNNSAYISYEDMLIDKKTYKYTFQKNSLYDKSFYYSVNRPYLEPKNESSILRIENYQYLDYEIRSQYLLNDIKICAEELGTQFQMYQPQTVCREFLIHIILEDINDNRPYFKQNVYSNILSEFSPINSFVCKVEASDNDINSKLSYSLPSQKYSDYFSINPDTGILVLKKPFDNGLKQDLVALVVKVDDGNSEHIASTNVEIKITRNRDERITLTTTNGDNFNLNIPENSKAGTLLMTFRTNKHLDYSKSYGFSRNQLTPKLSYENSNEITTANIYDIYFDDKEMLLNKEIVKDTIGKREKRDTSLNINNSMTIISKFEISEENRMIIYEFYDPEESLDPTFKNDIVPFKTRIIKLMQNQSSVVKNNFNLLEHSQTSFKGIFCLGTFTGRLTLCQSSDKSASQHLDEPLDREREDRHNFTVIARSISVAEDHQTNRIPHDLNRYRESREHLSPGILNVSRDKTFRDLIGSKHVKMNILSSAFAFIFVKVEDIDDNVPRFVTTKTNRTRFNIDPKNQFKNLNAKFGIYPVPKFRDIAQMLIQPPSEDTSVIVSQNDKNNLLLPPVFDLEIIEDDEYIIHTENKLILKDKSAKHKQKDPLGYWNELRKNSFNRLNTNTPIVFADRIRRDGIRYMRELATLNVSDPDLGSNGTFYFCLLCADFPENHISLEYYSGKILSHKYIDREYRNSYSALVQVNSSPYKPCDPTIYQDYDYKNPNLIKVCRDFLTSNVSFDSNGITRNQLSKHQNLSRLLVDIRVKDINDHPPRFEKSTYNLGLHWRVTRNFVVTRIRILDNDTDARCCRNYSLEISDIAYYRESTLNYEQIVDKFFENKMSKGENKLFSLESETNLEGDSIITVRSRILGMEKFVNGYFKINIKVKDNNGPKEFSDSTILNVWIYGEGRTLIITMNVRGKMGQKQMCANYNNIVSKIMGNNIILSTREAERELNNCNRVTNLGPEDSNSNSDNKNILESVYANTIVTKTVSLPLQVVDRSDFHILSEQQILHLIDSKPNSFHHYQISSMTIKSIKPLEKPIKRLRDMSKNILNVPGFPHPDVFLQIMIAIIMGVLIMIPIVTFIIIFAFNDEQSPSNIISSLNTLEIPKRFSLNDDDIRRRHWATYRDQSNGNSLQKYVF
ncbi:unnamed protein product [Gordionus sp. m RMFG-2023]